MWRGFAHFGHVRASATLAAHGLLTLRVLLTSDMSAISRQRLTLPLPRPHTLQSDRNQPAFGVERVGVRQKTPQLQAYLKTLKSTETPSVPEPTRGTTSQTAL
ncbi:hypothetical protein Q5P01_005869 [Channa striata]|uniref:Uncharacterized protein n=1 Tax=Channa striata TaxID=64152 RepID=A0AA88NED4_CHASR|nr:hypothetical protein Q5P01_005869 [Channa striata]